MIAGTLEVQMLANLARISDDMRKVQGIIGGAMGNVERAVAGAKAALGALGIGIGAGYFVSLVKGAIDAADKFNDLTQSIGINRQELAKYQLATAQSGTTLEGLAKGVKGLASAFAEHGGELRAAGITAATTDGKMRQLADIFANMPDGMEKTTLAVKLFGKSGMELIPMLNMGAAGLAASAEKSAQYAAVLATLAPRADEFNDIMAELGMATKVSSMVLINDALPALQRIAGAMAAAAHESNIFKVALVGLGGVVTEGLSGWGSALHIWWLKLNAYLDSAGAKLMRFLGASKDAGKFENSANEFALAVQKLSERDPLGVTPEKTFDTDKWLAQYKKMMEALGLEGKRGNNEAAKEAQRLLDANLKGYLAYYQALVDAADEEAKAVADIQIKELKEWQDREDRLHRESIAGWIAYADAIVQANFDEAQQLAKDQIEAANQVKEAEKRANEERLREQKRVADETDRLLGDAIMRGFERGTDFAKNFRDTLVNMFKTLVLRPIVSFVLQPITGAIGAALGGMGLSGAANAAGGGGAINSMGTLSSLGNLIYGGIGGGVGSIGAAGIMTAAPVYEAGVMVAAAETASIASSAGVSAALSAIGPIGWAAMAVGAMAALGFFGGDSRTATPQMSGLGSTGTISRAGFSGQQWVASGSSPSDLWAGSQWSNLAPDTAAGFNTAIKKIFDDMTKQAVAAGIGVEALANLTVTMGATGQGVQQDMVTALNKTADTVAETLMPGIEALQQSGETLTQTFVRVTNAQITYKAQLAATQRGLFEQILQAQGNIGQYTTMIREDVLKTLDIVSQDLQKQLWAAEEAAAATTSRTAAMQAYEVLAGSVSQKQLDRERALAEATDAATIVWLKAAYALQDIQAADAAHTSALQQYDIAAGTLTQKDVDRQNALAAAYDDTTRTFLQMTYALQDSNAAATEAATAQAALAAQQKQLADAARALTQGNLSPLVTGEKLSVAQSSLQDIYQKALTGDSGAIGALPSAATDYLTQLRAMYSSSSAYTAGFQMVMDMLASAAGTPGHAAGLDYVPRDDYFMRAHRGEAVLSAPQAANWRSGSTGITSADLAALRSDLQRLTAIVAAGDSANVAATQSVAKAQQDIAWRQEIKPKLA